MNRTLSSVLLASSLLAAAPAMAGDIFQWQSNSLTYLNGRDFTVNPEIQQTFTFEHADSWKYGDNFLFVDKIFYNGKKDANAGDNTYYGEISPRLSMGKIFGQKFEFGPITDVLLAATYEFGEGDNESYLIGPAFDLKIPGFDYFQLNFYQRHTEGNRPGDGVWQITPVWSYTIPVGKSDVLIDGFMDWVVDNDETSRGTYHSTCTSTHRSNTTWARHSTTRSGSCTSVSSMTTGPTNTASRTPARSTPTRTPRACW